MDERRSTPRIQFPTDFSPRFLTIDGTARVTDCGSDSLRVERLEGVPPPTEGTSIVGTLILVDGSEMRLSGVIIRCDPDTVAIKLDAPGIPESRLATSLSEVVRPA